MGLRQFSGGGVRRLLLRLMELCERLVKVENDKMKMLKKKNFSFVISILALWICFWLYMLFDSRDEFKDFNNAADNFSGKYIFARSLCKGNCELGNPFVSFNAASNNTDVVVSHVSKKVLRISYEKNSGIIHTMDFDLSGDHFGWCRGALYYIDDQVPGVGVPILPGFVKRTRRSMISKTQNGDLIIESSFAERGMILFLLPFWERHTYQMILERKSVAVGDNDENTTYKPKTQYLSSRYTVSVRICERKRCIINNIYSFAMHLRLLLKTNNDAKSCYYNRGDGLICGRHNLIRLDRTRKYPRFLIHSHFSSRLFVRQCPIHTILGLFSLY